MALANPSQPGFVVLDTLLMAIGTLAAFEIRLGEALDWNAWTFQVHMHGSVSDLSWGQIIPAIATYVLPALAAIHLAHSPGLVRSFGPGGFMRLAIFMAIAAIPSTAIYALVRPPNFPLSFILLALVFSVALQGAGRTAQFVASGKPLANAGISGWAINTGLVVIGIVVAVALLEAALRFHNPLEYKVRGSKIVLPTSTKVVYRNSMPVPGRSDALIELTCNKLGFRGPDAPPDFDVWLTILTVGGSTTEDVSLTDGKTWTDRLQQMLAPAFSKLWVNNAGFVGHSSHAHVQLLRRFIVPMRPDVVIFLVGINDMGRDQLPDTFASYDDNLSARKNQIRPLFDILADHSEVGSLLYNLDRAMRAWVLGYSSIDTKGVGAGISFEPAPLGAGSNTTTLLARFRDFQQAYRARLETLVDVSHANGIMPVLVTQPFVWGDSIDPTTGTALGAVRETLLDTETTSLTYWHALEIYNDTMRGVARAKGVTLVDLARQMPKDSHLFIDRMHFGNDGALLVGKIVAQTICPTLAKKFPIHLKANGSGCGGLPQ